MSSADNQSGSTDDHRRHAGHGGGKDHVHGSHRHAAGDDHHRDYGSAGHVRAPVSFGKAFSEGNACSLAPDSVV